MPRPTQALAGGNENGGGALYHHQVKHLVYSSTPIVFSILPLSLVFGGELPSRWLVYMGGRFYFFPYLFLEFLSVGGETSHFVLRAVTLAARVGWWSGTGLKS